MRTVEMGLLAVLALACPAARNVGTAPELEGERLPALSFTDLEGGTHTLDEVRGEVVLLDFWATWCAPCRESLPLYDTWQTELADAGLQVIAVSVDENPDDVPPFAEESFPHVTVWLDTDHQAADALQLPGMPTAFLLRRDGTVAHREVGFHSRNANAFRQRIEALLTPSAESPSE